MRNTVHEFVKESRCVSFLEPTAILVPTPPQARQKVRPDIAISDYEMADTLQPGHRGGIVVDVVTAHPITAVGKARGGVVESATSVDGSADNVAHEVKSQRLQQRDLPRPPRGRSVSRGNLRPAPPCRTRPPDPYEVLRGTPTRGTSAIGGSVKSPPCAPAHSATG